MPKEFCPVCGCDIPNCKHTAARQDSYAGPWLRVCVTQSGTEIIDNLQLGTLDRAIEHAKATMVLNPQYSRVIVYEGDTSNCPVAWDSINQEIADAAMLQAGIEPKPKRKKPEYKMLNPQFFPCVSIRPDLPENAGKFVAEGFIPYVNDDDSLDIPEFKTRTSFVIKVDIEAGYFETLNSIYWIV